MLRKIWGFLAEPKNLAVLTLAGGAVAFVWKVGEPRIFPAKKAPVTAEAPAAERGQVAIANGAGAQAINADGQATVGEGAHGSMAPLAPSTSSTRGNQRAEASNGASAINAGDQSRVVIERSTSTPTAR